ncbi:flippase [Patescibacteria group bacterium]|nr:flippase [Patescibacteria group bacterium]
MQTVKKISEQTLWQVLGKIITSLSTFIILGLVARNYGKEGTGIFTLALAYLAIFYLLADFGFNAHVLRNKAKTKSEWQKLLGTRLVWSAVLVILAVGLLPLWPFATAGFTMAVVFGSLAIIAYSVFVTCNLIFQKKLIYNLSVLASGIGTLVGLAVFIFLVAFRYSVPVLIFAHLVGYIAISVSAIFLVRKFLDKISPIFSMTYTKELFNKSWPIAATLSLNVLYFRVDAFMVAYFKSSSDVGIYNVAYSVFQAVLVLPTFIMNAYYPLMLKSLGRIKVVAAGLFGLAFLGTGFAFLFSPIIIEILTGGGFDGSIYALRVLSLGFPAYFISALLMWVFITKGRYQKLLLVYAFGLLVNVVLNFIYIPQYSYLAASWTTVISEYLILLLQVVILIPILKHEKN